jgi:nicotinamide-nucleotide amidase
MSGKTKEIYGSLVAIGDELLLGDILDTNSHHIASELRRNGFRLRRIVTAGDREESIVETLPSVLADSSFLIATGGLGPTADDCTGPAVAKAFGLELEANRPYMDYLEGRMQELKRPMTSEVSKMAILPEGAEKLLLGSPMAGFYLEIRSKPCFFLPGVPFEMRRLMAECVIPRLQEQFPDRPAIRKRILRVQDLPEAEIGNRLSVFDKKPIPAEIAYYPQTGENWVKLLVLADSAEEADKRLQEAERAVIGEIGAEHVSGHHDEPLELVVGRMLRKRGWTLATAESCTGGLLSYRITAVSGASDYFDRAFVTYSNQAKVEQLDVPEELLDRYGAVSEPVARAMAEGARRAAGSDAALSITGIAGPTGGTAEKPVGTVFIGCATQGGTQVIKRNYGGGREQVQQRSAQGALVLLWRVLWP